MLHSLGTQAFLPAPVLLVATYDHQGRPNIMPACSGGLCSAQPPTIGVAIRKIRWTHAAIMERRSFTVNLPSKDMIAQVDFAGLHTGEDMDKLAALNLESAPAEHVDAPILTACPLIIELSLLQTVELGSHTLCIGEIMDVKGQTNILREDGLPDPAQVNPAFYMPLVCEYWGLGSFEARAFSAGHILSQSAVVD